MLPFDAPLVVQFGAFFWDSCAEQMTVVFQDRVSTVLPYCDFVFGNETEAATFGEIKVNMRLSTPQQKNSQGSAKPTRF